MIGVILEKTLQMSKDAFLCFIDYEKSLDMKQVSLRTVRKTKTIYAC